MKGVFSLVLRFAPYAALCGVVLAGPGIASAQTTPGSRVLVMPFAATVEANAQGGSGAALWLGEAASILIAEGLSTVGVGTVSRDERLAAFDELNLPMTPALTRATMIRVAELIGASEIVFGEVQLGATLKIHARLVRLSAGREAPSVDDSGPMTEIFDLFARVAGRVAGQTGRLRPTTTARCPVGSTSYSSSSRMMPPGVQDTKPRCPRAMLAKDAFVTPSTSLVGAIASKTARSSTWPGIGCCTRIPSTPASRERP